MAQHVNSHKHRLILMPSGRQGDVPHGMTALSAARQLGVELESICGGRQTCGKCLITVESGTFAKHNITSSPDHLSPPDERELAYARKNNLDLQQYRLGCSACIEGDVLLHIPETSLARKQVVRKAVGDTLKITVAPAMQQVFVEVPPAVPGGRSDARRLLDAIAEQWHFNNVYLAENVLPTLQTTLRRAQGAVTVTIWRGQEVVRIEPGYVEGLYGLAVDIGSTTVAGYLCDLRTGAVLATATMMNPQVRYGEDLISRISYAAEPGGFQRLHRVIVKALDDLGQEAAQIAGIAADEIVEIVLVGNTVMHHIVLGLDPAELGHLPFALAVDDAQDLRAAAMGLRSVHSGARVHVLPCIAGYVGADNVGVLLAEYPYLDDRITLIVDIGTNAEILLCTKDRILSASSPTGPAFEGAHITHGQRAAIGAIERVRISDSNVRYKVIGDDRWVDMSDASPALRPTGICGSGIIEVVAELFRVGLIDASGRFVNDAEARHPAVRRVGRVGELVLAQAGQTATGQDIVITQKDIRAIQLAKGALYAGARLLMNRLGVDHVDHIRLAGAFGSYIDPYYAMQIGLIPDCDLRQVVSVGNAAGDGARIALLNLDQRRYIQELVRRVEYVETAAESQFQDYFVDAMILPHATDTFPHLEMMI